MIWKVWLLNWIVRWLRPLPEATARASRLTGRAQ